MLTFVASLYYIILTRMEKETQTPEEVSPSAEYKQEILSRLRDLVSLNQHNQGNYCNMAGQLQCLHFKCDGKNPRQIYRNYRVWKACFIVRDSIASISFVYRKEG